jgi:predicted transcriptional regulator
MKQLFRIILLATTFSIFLLPEMLSAQSDYEKQIAAFANTIAEKVSQSGKLRVAVSDFCDNNETVTEFGKAMAEEFSVNLMNDSKGFQVMERSNLNAILREHKLATTGLIDPETAKKLGRLKAVDIIIVGTITPFADYFRMSIKILDTETGMAMGGTLGNIARTEPLNKLFANRIGGGSLEVNVPTSNNNTEYQNAANTTAVSKNGNLRITNRSSNIISVIVSDVKVDLINNRMSRYEITTVSANSYEVVPELIPGIYYVCLIDRNNGGFGDPVLQSKKIVIEAGKQSQISF